jgi:cytochrome c556
MRSLHMFGALALVLSAAVVGPAVAADVARTVKARQDNMKLIARSLKAIADETKRDAPDRAAIQTRAAFIAANARQMPKWFPRGSGPQTGLEMRAKAEIWQDQRGFNRNALALQIEAAKLTTLADAASVEALRTQLGAVGKGCKSCHDSFQAPRK